jgi:hypothetical protein
MKTWRMDEHEWAEFVCEVEARVASAQASNPKARCHESGNPRTDIATFLVTNGITTRGLSRYRSGTILAVWVESGQLEPMNITYIIGAVPDEWRGFTGAPLPRIIDAIGIMG